MSKPIFGPIGKIYLDLMNHMNILIKSNDIIPFKDCSETIWFDSHVSVTKQIV
jgi:hypothetical protein